jgi:hypothetical protein
MRRSRFRTIAEENRRDPRGTTELQRKRRCDAEKRIRDLGSASFSLIEDLFSSFASLAVLKVVREQVIVGRATTISPTAVS